MRSGSWQAPQGSLVWQWKWQQSLRLLLYCRFLLTESKLSWFFYYWKTNCTLSFVANDWPLILFGTWLFFLSILIHIWIEVFYLTAVWGYFGVLFVRKACRKRKEISDHRIIIRIRIKMVKKIFFFFSHLVSLSPFIQTYIKRVFGMFPMMTV